MTMPDSLKILQIARHSEFKSRVFQRLLKFVDYKAQGSDNDKEQVMLDARKAWAPDSNLEIVAMLVLNDVNLLNKAEPSSGGIEITDEELSGRLEFNLHAWASILP